jgi:hypothetical protein
MKRTVVSVVILALVGAAVWFGWQRTRPQPVVAPADLTMPDGTAAKTQVVDLTKHDGQTLDFSSGKPVVKDSPEDKAALDAGAKDLADATKGVTFEPVKKAPEPAPVPPKS